MYIVGGSLAVTGEEVRRKERGEGGEEGGTERV